LTRRKKVCDFLLRWPSLEALHRVRRETLLKFFQQHHSVRTATLQKRVDSIKASQLLTTDRAVINASMVMCKALVSQMKSTLMAIKEFDSEIAAICSVHQDFALFKSLPSMMR